ncbi:phage shock protein C (PspC) family protein [Micromonospora matsumotoense]|uniref:Phage shock protein C (PspC) family protein n=1 Tax=Micromonospora matsumotoense TaxID=121616 RepID=A0A1C5AQB5_9ACTN|nr:PspC domain-containing protein [Micromonospora matsumotoense]SCF47204.1 phage shock protein C (PspC) family protein [Micromonospora matsumotoense]
MNDPTTIRLTGHTAAFPATHDARAALRRYLDEAHRGLRGDAGTADEDADDIVRDLESAIGDRLSTLTGPALDPVTGAQMAAILTEFGPVSPAGPPPPSVTPRPRGRFWCRIDEGKWFGGVCLGIAAYGGFRVDWVRTVVLLLTLVTGGLLGIPYLVLLLALPAVPTVIDYERRRDAPRPA